MAGKGFQAKAGIKRASTWGTAVTVTANDGFYFLTESIGGGRSVDEDMSLTGKAWGNVPSLGSGVYEGDMTQWLRYGYGCPVIAALALGADTVTAVSTGGGVYLHQMTAEDTNNLFSTLAVSKDIDVWEFDSVVVDKLTISGSGADRMQMTSTFLCRDLDRDSATNATTSMESSVSYYGQSSPIYFTQARFRLNTDAGALDSGDDICPSSFEINFENLMARDFLACDDNALVIAQPTRETFGKVSGFIEFPERTAQTYDDLFFNESTFKMEVYFATTATIAAGYPYYWQFEIPYARVMSWEAPITGPERILQRVDWQGFDAAATPTGMYSPQPLNLLIQDGQSSAYTTSADFS